MEKKIAIGVIGATGYVGQKLLSLLQDHPYFDIKKLAASANSKGKKYKEAIANKHLDFLKLGEDLAEITVEEVNEKNASDFAQGIDLCFCAVNLEKAELIRLEESLAKAGLVVVSNNSANRMQEDIPMIIPEINAEHLAIIPAQQKRLGIDKGFIVCKPNCSIQSYVPALDALKDFGIEEVFVSTYQAISGAGKTFDTWPEARDTVIPFIGGEEAKSETEPLKIWASLENEKLTMATSPKISAHCYRVGVLEGHMAAVTVRFKNKPTKEKILHAWDKYQSNIDIYHLPSAPEKFLEYFVEHDRPQSKLDAQRQNGMSISISNLCEDPILDYKFTCLSNNTIRGAAGGAVLTAELLVAKNLV